MANVRASNIYHFFIKTRFHWHMGALVNNKARTNDNINNNINILRNSYYERKYETNQGMALS